MPRYIDAERFKLWLQENYVLYDGDRYFNDIDAQPTADVVEVVRCKDCFYAKPYNEIWTLPKKNDCMWCKRYDEDRPLDWFCADGLVLR